MVSGRLARKGGYTLIEVLVAIVILAFVLPGLIYMVTGARKTQVGSLRFEAGAEAAMQLINEMAIQPPGFGADAGTKVITEAGRDYTLQWSRTAYASGGTNLGGRQVQVTVSWIVGNKTRSTIIVGVLP